jgi:iron complex transport system permease protein
MISPDTTIEVVLNAIFQINDPQLQQQTAIITGLRFPRTLACMLVGAGMAISGATFQGLFRNPLVSPDILGVSTGAGFGTALGILLLGFTGATSFYAFLFGLISVSAAYLLAKNRNHVSTISLVLSGIIVSSIFTALTSLIKYVADPYDKLPAITYWLMGSFSKVTYSDIKMIAVPIVICIVILLLLRWRINILSLGDEEAKSLGIDPVKIRIVAIVASTIIVAASVSIAGVIGWVGLVVPHISRRIVGVDHKNLLPASCLVGGTFLIIVDILARTLTPAEIPIGILTALVGAPFFAFLLKKVSDRGEW